MWLTIIIAIGAGIGLALIVFALGWLFKQAMRKPHPEIPYAKQDDVDLTTHTRERRRFPLKWVSTLVILVGIVALLVFVVIPALKSSDIDNGAWQTRAVTPITFIGESVTQSADSNGQWSNKCYTYDIGNSWRVASQDPLDIGQTYNIRGQVQQLTDGTTWFIEEARR